MQTMKPLLSTPITLPVEKRYAGTTLGLILQQVSKAAGSQIGGGLMRPNDFLLEVTVGANNEPADHVIARFLAAKACPNSAREGCGPVIAQTTWDVGYYFDLDYAPRYGYVLGINRLPNSRWIVTPPPAKPRPRPTPNPDGDATGRIKAR
ncbi:MAG: hypothetical protein HY313_02305 [Acidobacteria bacterium]|nr:hypothetical protein [Acidobacteriota bacterium]